MASEEERGDRPQPWEVRALRADRLLSILMLLQSRGRLTAGELAAALEVSVRTIYRDLDALSAAGVPVYAERGPGGCCALLDSYRTTLTGLTRDEVRALFMLTIPAPLTDLGLGQDLRAALVKLSAALPDTRRGDEELARQRVHLDPSGWSHERDRELVPHLRTVHQALWAGLRLHLVYALPFDTRAAWLVEPYGLVAKAGRWYLVCARQEQVRVYPLSGVLEAYLSEQPFDYPAGFDLVAFWQAWCASVQENRAQHRATVRVAPELLALLPRLIGDAARGSAAAASTPDAQGWLTLTLVFETLEEARARLLSLGGAVEVLAPPELRDSVLDHARQAVARYRP